MKLLYQQSLCSSICGKIMQFSSTLVAGESNMANFPQHDTCTNMETSIFILLDHEVFVSVCCGLLRQDYAVFFNSCCWRIQHGKFPTAWHMYQHGDIHLYTFRPWSFCVSVLWSSEAGLCSFLQLSLLENPTWQISHSMTHVPVMRPPSLVYTLRPWSLCVCLFAFCGRIIQFSSTLVAGEGRGCHQYKSCRKVYIKISD